MSYKGQSHHGGAPAASQAGVSPTAVEKLESLGVRGILLQDVCLMGGGVVTSALAAGVLDEVIVHQVPVLLGDGRPYFQELPAHVRLSLVEAVLAPGVTHLHYQVER